MGAEVLDHGCIDHVANGVLLARDIAINKNNYVGGDDSAAAFPGAVFF